MIEKTVLDYLNSKLNVNCYMNEPEGQTSFVVIEKTGSSVTEHIKSGTLAIQSYAPTLYAAATLNEAVKTAMEKIVETTAVIRCRLISDYNFTNTAKKQPRYQAVFELLFY